MWSIACVAYEASTGRKLFDPEAVDGESTGLLASGSVDARSRWNKSSGPGAQDRAAAIVGGDIANIEAAAVTWRKWGSDATAAAVDEQRDRTMLLQMVQTIGPAPEEVTSTIICLDGGTQLMILFLYPAYPPFDKDDLAPHFFLSGFIPCNR